MTKTRQRLLGTETKSETESRLRPVHFTREDIPYHCCGYEESFSPNPMLMWPIQQTMNLRASHGKGYLMYCLHLGLYTQSFQAGFQSDILYQT